MHTLMYKQTLEPTYMNVLTLYLQQSLIKIWRVNFKHTILLLKHFFITGKKRKRVKLQIALNKLLEKPLHSKNNVTRVMIMITTN